MGHYELAGQLAETAHSAADWQAMAALAQVYATLALVDAVREQSAIPAPASAVLRAAEVFATQWRDANGGGVRGSTLDALANTVDAWRAS